MPRNAIDWKRVPGARMDEPVLLGEDGAGNTFSIRGLYRGREGRHWTTFYEVHVFHVRAASGRRAYVGKGRTLTSAKLVAGRVARKDGAS